MNWQYRIFFNLQVSPSILFFLKLACWRNWKRFLQRGFSSCMFKKLLWIFCQLRIEVWSDSHFVFISGFGGYASGKGVYGPSGDTRLAVFSLCHAQCLCSYVCKGLRKLSLFLPHLLAERSFSSTVWLPSGADHLGRQDEARLPFYLLVFKEWVRFLSSSWVYLLLIILNLTIET